MIRLPSKGVSALGCMRGSAITFALPASRTKAFYCGGSDVNPMQTGAVPLSIDVSSAALVALGFVVVMLRTPLQLFGGCGTKPGRLAKH